jgi:hypothetical protein
MIACSTEMTNMFCRPNIMLIASPADAVQITSPRLREEVEAEGFG